MAERVVALGGVPVSGPAALEDHAPVDFEGGDVYDARTSLELADGIGDYATSEPLRDRLEALEEDADDLGNFLAADTLVRHDATG
jgi:DNA-binding ferritin-like protein